MSHRTAADEHDQVLQLGGGGGDGSGALAADPTAPPLEVMVTGDTTRIALPSAPDGGDNFVVGLAIDTSCDMVGTLWWGLLGSVREVHKGHRLGT